MVLENKSIESKIIVQFKELEVLFLWRRGLQANILYAQLKATISGFQWQAKKEPSTGCFILL